MDNLIRTDTVFGKRVNIVGNISADLVLESLGKIYIKSRNKSQTLEEVIKNLAVEDPNISTSRVKVVNGTEELDTTEFKEGTFVFDKLSSILYLFIDNELLELVNVAPEGTDYVKRSGDTMSGRLAIYVKNGPPLYVNSADLVENLNAQYLNGEDGKAFTRRNKDEKINGSWTFRNPTTFESSALFYKDIVTHGSIGTSEFSSGFGGYGWRLDADTNTLTIDNLIVRKMMQVYEFVVNKISATNGSLWITNAGKVKSVQKLEIKENTFFSDTPEYEKFCLSRHQGDYFIKLTIPIQYKTFTDPVAAFSTASGTGVNIKQCWSNSNLQNARLIKILSSKLTQNDYFTDLGSSEYRLYGLFDYDFVFDCIFPIITRENYAAYLQDQSQDFTVSNVYTYFKYFAGGDFYIVTFDDDELPVFEIGDILRCQKWTYGGIKYYDAVVCNIIGKSYIIQLADSILDKKTTVIYDSSLEAQTTIQEDEVNIDLYKQSSLYKEPSQEGNSNYDDEGNLINLNYQEQQKKNLIGKVEINDSLVQIGNLWNPQRQNAVYITSTDNGAPFMDVISGVNRPDYSVIYYVPIYQTIKLCTTTPVDRSTFTGYRNLTDIPYTGTYYIQKDSTKCEYVYFKYNNVYYLAYGNSVPSIPGDSVEVIYYLNTIPDENTAFGEAYEPFYILTEDGKQIVTEGLEGGEQQTEKPIILEETRALLQVASTRTTKARLGNLDGIQDEIFPIDRQPYGYGLYAQNVFLTGEFYLNNGRSVADIGNEAISFAIASQNSIYNSMNILKEDLKKADELLSQSVYSKGELRTAGMRIGNDANNNPGILLWGNSIIIATTADEFAGKVDATALFANGRIVSKFISVNNIHSALGFGNTIPVIQVEYEYEGQKYYREQELFSETTVVDGETQTQYYYINELTGDRVYKPFSGIYGNTTYGWNLEATGEGYLAQRNISWQKNGQLTIKGDIEIQEPNGIHIMTNSGYNALNITGRSMVSDPVGAENSQNSLTKWTKASVQYFYFQSSYTNLTPVDVTQDIQNINNGTYNPEYPFPSFGSVTSINIGLANMTISLRGYFSYNNYSSAYQRFSTPYPLILILNFANNPQEVYALYSLQSWQYTIGSDTLKNIQVCVMGTNHVTMQGHISYYSTNVASEIGTNFIGMYGDNSLLWFGDCGFKVGYIVTDAEQSTMSKRFSQCALSVDKNGVALLPKVNNNNLSAVIDELSADTTQNGIDLLYGIDGTVGCRYYPSDESVIVDGETNFYTYDPNAKEETRRYNQASYDRAIDEITYYIYPGLGERKIHIIKPSTHNIRLYISEGDRVGQIIAILRDTPTPSGNLGSIILWPGNRVRIYNYIGDHYVPNSNEHSYVVLPQRPLFLMYMGEKNVGESETKYVWKELSDLLSW